MLIAQVSDIHASSENDHLQRFERVLTWLADLQPDILVLTGDLTDGGWREGYQQIAERLERQNYPSLILPGNSDDRHLMAMIWGSVGRSDTPTQALHFSHQAGELRLIGLDSTVDRQDYGCVTGHLEWLDKQLNDAGNSPALLFMHHHVFESGIPTLDESMCRGIDLLETLIKNAPAGYWRLLPGMFTGQLRARLPVFRLISVAPSARPILCGLEQKTFPR